MCEERKKKKERWQVNRERHLPTQLPPCLRKKTYLDSVKDVIIDHHDVLREEKADEKAGHGLVLTTASLAPLRSPRVEVGVGVNRYPQIHVVPGVVFA